MKDSEPIYKDEEFEAIFREVQMLMFDIAMAWRNTKHPTQISVEEEATPSRTDSLDGLPQ